MREFKFRSTNWVLFFSLIGFGLRLYHLDFQPLWGDEGWTFYFATQPVGQLLALTANNIHPPLYYLLLKGWFAIVGTGPEEARFFSVTVGTALIPLLGRLGRRLFDERVEVAVAALVSVMPLAIYYAQEVRMYGLVTLLGAMSVYFFISGQKDEKMFLARSNDFSRLSQHKRLKSLLQTPHVFLNIYRTMGRPAAYVLTMTAALYTEYYAVFILLFQLLYSGFRALKKISRFEPGRFIMIGLLYLPWVIYAAPRLLNYVLNKVNVEDYTPLNFLHFLGDYFVAFSVGHLAPELQLYSWVALPFVLVASVGFIAVLYLNRGRAAYLYLYLFIPLLLGYAVNLLFPFTPPYFERTLLLAAPAYWLFMALGLVWLWDRHDVFASATGLLLLLIMAVSLAAFYQAPRYPHEDYRPLLADLAVRATPEDTVLASYQWQIGFYQAYLSPPRPHIFAVPGWGRDWAGPAGHDRLTQDLAELLERSPRLWFPAYQAKGHLWEDEAETALAELGYPALLQWYTPQTKLTLTGAAHGSLQTGPAANFGQLLTLLEAKVGAEKYEAGRGIVPVELVWQKEKGLGSEHRVSLRLADPAGRTWAIRDSYPRAGQLFFTDLAIGDTLTDRHGLLIPAGTPPGPYRLLLSLRRVSDAHPLDLLDATGQPMGAELLLAEVAVIDPNPPVGPAALPSQVASDATFGQAARLAGYSLGQGPFKAGELLPLNLFWESLAERPGPLTVSIQLQDQAGQPVVSHERMPLRSTAEWQRGTLLRDPHDLLLPPTLPPGAYQLLVGLIGPDQSWLKVHTGEQLRLTTLTTVDRPHSLEAPDPQISLVFTFGSQAKLVGVDLPHDTVKAGRALPLTLYWQALATADKSWTVFVHLIDDQGHIVTQQDQIPGGGQLPTTGWLPHEYLVDSYNLSIPPDTPPGRNAYRLAIGLYDANDFSRLPVVESGQDHVILKSWPISVE